MAAIHTEKTFEDAIEASLLQQGGYVKGDPATFSRELALDPTQLLAFIEETQPKVWSDLRQHLKGQLESTFLDALAKALDAPGGNMLAVLRHGVKFYGKLIRLAYFKPASGLNPDTLALYAKNRLTVTRQLHYSTANANSLDMVLSLNGLPVATLELKNQFTHQAAGDAKRQFAQDRDPHEKLFQFAKRTLVHFAVDPDEVYMTTRLEGAQTTFLPFNRGANGGAGNPDNPEGYRTAYLWGEVLSRDSLLDILGRFMHLAVTEKTVGGKKVRKEALIFPRYHQIDSVRRLEAAARADGPGHNYLIQHSTGSGKSNSIAWLAYRLSSLHTENDQKVFDSVVVITDRRVLDQQLQDTIYQFEHRQGVVQKIDENSTQLAEALSLGVPIIITTLQKFPFVTEKIGTLPKRRYAVIIDEAHSSQSGESAQEMKKVLAAKDLEEAARAEAAAQGLDEYDERILKTVMARGKQPNISFFAFTATPKGKTLQVFNQPGPSGTPPFHLYTMRQAIEEGFILDVLAHYTTYKAYYRLVKSVEDDPKVKRKAASRALARFMSLHPHNLAQKTEVMVEHFRAFTRHKIGGRAKAMVVTSSRLHAVRYKQEFDRYLQEKGYHDIRTLVAFSGEVKDPKNPEITYTEVEMNGGIRESELPEKFDSEEYHVLLVAEKYQTGFDQPLLHTMYVDRKLTGLQAVQTLSRLNRTCPGKEDTFVLDFVNEAEEIREAFQPYYEQTGLAQAADPQQLYTLQAKLDGFQVYYQSEVEAFCRVFFSGKTSQTAHEHARMNAALDPAVDRFKALDEEQQNDFKVTLTAFVRLYAFLSQIIPYQDTDLEKLYSFARFLVTKLPSDGATTYTLDDDVALKYYRLQKISEGSITLKAGEGGQVSGPTATGTGINRDEIVILSSIIEVLNAKFGTAFTLADQLFFDQVTEESVANADIAQAAQANEFDNFRLAYDRQVPGILLDRMEGNQEIVAKFFNDPEFQRELLRLLARQVYDRVRASGDQAQASDTNGPAPGQ